MDFCWIFKQFILPVMGPIAVAALFAWAWSTGEPGFKPSLPVILDVTPRALTFYNLALISITLSDFWPRVTTHITLTVTTVLVGGLVAVYHSFTVIWRHDPGYAPGNGVYLTTLVPTLISVGLCHQCHRKGS